MIRVPITDAERRAELVERESFFRGAADVMNAAAVALVEEGKAFGGSFGRKVFLSDLADHVGMPMRRLAPLVMEFHTMGWVRLARADLVGAMDSRKVEASSITDGEAEYQFILAPETRPRTKRNPAPEPEDVDRAAERYEQFHRMGVNQIDLELDLEMPTHAREIGRATHVLYRSGKIDPETGKRPRTRDKTQNYIHEHDAGVCLYEPCAAIDGAVAVPKKIAKAQALVLLGDCLGFGYVDPDDGERYEMEGGNPMPQLYCTPDGKALVVVEGQREILFIVWGGALGVEPRGIVG